MTSRFSVIIAVAMLLWWTSATAQSPQRVAVFDLRPIKSNGQTDLSQLREAVKLSADLRDQLAEATDAQVVPPDEVKTILGALYRVTAFDCREAPACLQPMMRKLRRKGIARVVLGTYEIVGGQAQLTLNGVDTKTGAFTKVELFEVDRGSAPDPDAAQRVMLSVAAVPAKGSTPAGDGSGSGSGEGSGDGSGEGSGDGSGDDGGDQTDVLADMPPPPPPPVPDRIQVLGWLRANAAYFTEPEENDVIAAPHDRVESRNQLYLAARYQRGKRFEATASGVLEFDVFDRRTANEAEVRELYVGVFSKYVGLRLGNQRIAWGKGDAISPNDVINPRNLRDPFLTDSELRRIPTFVARVDIGADSHSLQLIGQPFFVPDRYDVYGANWSIIQPSTPEAVRGMFRLISGLFDESLHERTQDLFAQTSMPTRPSAGARYSYTGHTLDASLYYHFGYNSTPRVHINPMFAQAASMIDWRTATPSSLAPILGLLDMGIAPYRADFIRRHHVGIDGVTTLGPIAVKLDAAYETRSVYYQPDLESFVTPTVQAVLSIEYQTGELGKLILVEGIYNRMLDPPPAKGLIGYKQDTAGGALTARWTFADVIETELRAVVEVVPRTLVLQPQLAYKSKGSGYTVAVGALYIDGDPSSLGEYYSRNKCGYVTVKLPF